MIDWIKKYWWVLLIGAVVAPLVINWVILQPQQFDIVGDGTHWLGFWATYISAIASFAMVLITWFTLKQNKDQVNELKRQWKEQNRPYLSLHIARKEFSNGMYEFHLCITNVGNSAAYEVGIHIDESYLDKIYEQFSDINADENDSLFKKYEIDFRDRINKIITTKLIMQKGQRIDLFFVTFWGHVTPELSSNLWVATSNISHMLYNNAIPMTITYNDEYTQNEKVVFKAETTDIVDSLNNINTKLEKIAAIYEFDTQKKYDTR